MTLRTWFFLTIAWLVAGLVPLQGSYAQGGHGPVFGLATPTLPQGAWNADLTFMSAERSGRGFMTRQTIRYGLTPDLQLNLSVPISWRRTGTAPNTRVGTMMGGVGDAEVSAIWRFQKTYPGVGQRFESSLLVSGLYPLQDERRGVEVGPGVHAAIVTGYASRSIYAWAGGGVQRYTETRGSRLGDLYYLSAVFAWRPPVFRGDYPKPDLRFFVEALAERAKRDRIGGEWVASSGGDKLFVGPTLLGLYRAWGLGTGVLLPVYEEPNGPQPDEGPRLMLNLSYWF